MSLAHKITKLLQQSKSWTRTNLGDQCPSHPVLSMRPPRRIRPRPLPAGWRSRHAVTPEYDELLITPKKNLDEEEEEEGEGEEIEE